MLLAFRTQGGSEKGKRTPSWVFVLFCFVFNFGFFFFVSVFSLPVMGVSTLQRGISSSVII